MKTKEKKKVHVKTGDVICVEWIDSASEHSGWESIRDFYINIQTMRSFGVVVDITDKFIAITASYGYDEDTEYTQVNGVLAVPLVNVKEITHYSTPKIQGIKDKKEKTIIL